MEWGMESGFNECWIFGMGGLGFWFLVGGGLMLLFGVEDVLDFIY